MYIAACDDRQEEQQHLETLLTTWQRERQAPLRFKLFHSAAEMLSAAENEPFTLYLLDVMMPGMTGMDAAREIRLFDSAADIVFLTSSPDFAYESYRVQATDYLLKPIRAQMLFPILDKLLLREQQLLDGLTLKNGSTLTRLLFSQLIYVEVNGKHLYFNMTDGTTHQIYGTLAEYAPQLLSRPEFMQIHRSYIVNMRQAAELSPKRVLTFSGKELPISRLLYPQVQKDYMKLLFSRGEE